MFSSHMELHRVLRLKWKEKKAEGFLFTSGFSKWAKRLSWRVLLAGTVSVYRCEWLSVIECKLHFLCCAYPGKTKRKKRNNVPSSAHPQWNSSSFFRFIGSLSNLWRELYICPAVSTAANMYSFGFAFQDSGSIFVPLTKFLGRYFLPADLSGCPAPGLIVPPS